MRTEPLRIHVAAPPKPAVGAACNGCGLCCLAEPCPAGQLLTLQRRGACRLLRWDEAGSRYRCGLFGDAAPLRGRLAALAHRLRRRLAARWIAAGAGCDALLEASAAPR